MYATLVDRVTGMLEFSLQYAAAKLGETEAMPLLKKNNPDALGTSATGWRAGWYFSGGDQRTCFGGIHLSRNTR